MSKSKHSEWVTINTQSVYDNPWISVTHSEVLTPSNTSGIYGVVHFKHHAVGILAINDEGHIWLVEQTRYVFGVKTLEIPEGGARLDEEPLSAAKRELKEEVGLTAKHWQCLGRVDLSNSITDEQATLFLATGLNEGSLCHEETEDITVKKVSLTQAVAWVNSGVITDAMSVLALTKAQLLPELSQWLDSRQ